MTKDQILLRNERSLNRLAGYMVILLFIAIAFSYDVVGVDSNITKAFGFLSFVLLMLGYAMLRFPSFAHRLRWTVDPKNIVVIKGKSPAELVREYWVTILERAEAKGAYYHNSVTLKEGTDDIPLYLVSLSGAESVRFSLPETISGKATAYYVTCDGALRLISMMPMMRATYVKGKDIPEDARFLAYSVDPNMASRCHVEIVPYVAPPRSRTGPIMA